MNQDVVDLGQKVKIAIVARTAPDKPIRFYRIKPMTIYRWDLEDRAYMKQLNIKPLHRLVFMLWSIDIAICLLIVFVTRH